MKEYIVKEVSYEGEDRVITAVSMTNMQALPIAQVTTENRDAIPEPMGGIVIYNTDKKLLQFFDGENWKSVAVM
jgi:hypothetical protein